MALDKYFPMCPLVDTDQNMTHDWIMYFLAEQQKVSGLISEDFTPLGDQPSLSAEVEKHIDADEQMPLHSQLYAEVQVLREAVLGLLAERSYQLGTLSQQNADRGFITGYMDFWAQAANPPAPPAGVLRLHSTTTQGFTRFEQDNEAPTNIVLGRDNVFIVKNTSGLSMPKGSAVYIVASAGPVPHIALAKADVIGTLPAAGLLLDTIGNGNFGQCMKLGIINGIDTNAFTEGDSLYVSDSSAGALVNVRPVSPSLVERMATVLKKDATTGSILVVTAPFIGGMESGTTSTAWTAAGTIKPAQATPNAYLSSDSSAGISTTVTTASLVGKTLTIKDGIITSFT